MPRNYERRVDPLELQDKEFYRHFRFDKPSAIRLAEFLSDDLSYETRCGRPLSPVQQVCVALNSYAGGHFQRISGFCSGISQSTACRAIHREVSQIFKIQYNVKDTM
jgi:hypothetical protein